MLQGIKQRERTISSLMLDKSFRGLTVKNIDLLTYVELLTSEDEYDQLDLSTYAVRFYILIATLSIIYYFL